MQSITTILSLFKRPHTFYKQVERLRNQTVDTDIWVDCTVNDVLTSKRLTKIINKFPELKYNIHIRQNLYHIGRFYYAMNVQSKYTFIMDDDMLPGKNYLKHCINTQNDIGDCILTGYGVILNSDKKYGGEGYGWERIGCRGIENKDPIQVDMAGHSWFFPTKVCKYITYEDPPSIKNGEDLHFSYTAQKFGDISVYVAPHIKSQPENWSSEPSFSRKHNTDDVATSKQSNHKPLRDKAVRHYVSNGWKLIK